MSGASRTRYDTEYCDGCSCQLTDKQVHYIGAINRARYCLGCCPVNH